MTDRPGIDPDEVEHALALLDGFVRAHLYASDGDLEFAPHIEAPKAEMGAAAPPLGEAARKRVDLARTILVSRQLRPSFFEAHLFGEPSHDMLLALYVQQCEGRIATVSSLRLISGVATSTALRWITILLDDRILERVPDPTDGKREFIRLTDDSLDRMSRYLDAVMRETSAFWTAIPEG